MSRLGCWLGCTLWLVVMTVPVLIFVLAVKGEWTWRRGSFVEDRVWLVNAQNAPGTGDERGMGYSASRVISNPTAGDGPVCVRTHVYFFLWKGKSDQVKFCDCYLPGASGSYEPSGSCP